jgi:hypothetical protein
MVFHETGNLFLTDSGRHFAEEELKAGERECKIYGEIRVESDFLPP